MNLTKKLLSCLLLTAALPATAFADISFTNNTTSDVVTVSYRHLCSSLVAGGAIQPNGGKYTLSQYHIDNNCYKECLVDVFASPNCNESKKIATARISGKDGGVTTVNPINSSFSIAWSKTQASIKEAGALGWFKSMFG